MKRVALTALGALLVGCGDDGERSRDQGCVPGVYAGAWTETRITAAGRETTPSDMTGVTITALADDGALAIEAETYPGGFRIDGVPDGPLTILVEGLGAPSYTRTEGCRWDSNRILVGRADAVLPTSNETKLSIVADGLRPSTNQDYLVLFAPEPWAAFWTNGPAVGETSVSTYPESYQGADGPLIDGARGDVATIYQTSSANESSPVETSTIVAFGEAAPFTMIDGATTEVRATLATIALDREISFAIDQDAFAALGPGRAGIEYDGTSVILSAVPTVRLGCRSGSVDPLTAWAPAALTGRQELERIGFADPFPAEWARLVCVSSTFVPPPTEPLDLHVPVGWYGQYLSPDALDGASLAPQLSMPGNVALDGADLLEPGGSISTSPRITWESPEIGYPSSIFVYVYRSTSTEFGFYPREELASFEIEVGDELEIPEGILVPGETVQFTVGAAQRNTSISFRSPALVVE